VRLLTFFANGDSKLDYTRLDKSDKDRILDYRPEVRELGCKTDYPVARKRNIGRITVSLAAAALVEGECLGH